MHALTWLPNIGGSRASAASRLHILLTPRFLLEHILKGTAVTEASYRVPLQSGRQESHSVVISLTWKGRAYDRIFFHGIVLLSRLAISLNLTAPHGSHIFRFPASALGMYHGMQTSSSGMFSMA